METVEQTDATELTVLTAKLAFGIATPDDAARFTALRSYPVTDGT